MRGIADLSGSCHFVELERNLNEYEPPLQHGVCELLKAYELAIDANCGKWDFAVELSVLRRFGLTESDFRWMVCKGIAEHGIEVATKGGDKRTFCRTKRLKFKKRSCFVLTSECAEKLLGRNEPVVVLQTKQFAHDNTRLAPNWDGDRHELCVSDFLVKRFRWPAKNQETLLTAFDEEQWPAEGVDDPLPPHPDKDPKQRLRDTIKCLNRHHEHRLIHFRSDGTGERVIWDFTPEAIELFGVDRTTERLA